MDKIYIKDWKYFKPYEKHAASDSYYLKLSNKVFKRIRKINIGDIFELNKEQEKALVCFLTSYFEDIISETNVWHTFTRLHHKKYGKYLPFYDLSGYDSEYINPEDIRFLIWYFINTLDEEGFYYPNHNAFHTLSELIFDEFDKAYEYAPENTALQKIYSLKSDEKNFYTVRLFVETILFDAYLFKIDTGLRLNEDLSNTIEKNAGDEHLTMYLNDIRDGHVNKDCTSLLGMKGKEWAAEILGEEHPLHQDIMDISKKINGYFFYKSQDATHIYIEHVASGREFNLLKSSYQYHDKLEEDCMLIMGIVRWQGDWWFSGVSAQFSYNQKIVNGERKSMDSIKQVQFLAPQEPILDILQKQHKAFIDYNEGSLIKFISSANIHEFQNGFMEAYTKSLNISEEEVQETHEKHKDRGLGLSPKMEPLEGEDEPAAVFFNSVRGVEFVFGEVLSSFPTKDNPFYSEDESQQGIFTLLSDEDISKEVCMYSFEQCMKHKVPYYTQGLGKQLVEDIDFMLRFWKKENYFSKPNITTIS